MSNESKLFEEELARRNPDWKKIVSAHNAALAAERERLEALQSIYDETARQLTAERERSKALVDALTIIRDKIYQIAGAKKIATLALESVSNCIKK